MNTESIIYTVHVFQSLTHIHVHCPLVKTFYMYINFYLFKEACNKKSARENINARLWENIAVTT